MYLVTLVMYSISNRVFSITKTIFDAYGNSQELRAVERKKLLETLAKQLPVDSITFSSKLAKIHKHEDGETLLELVNGTRISSKVDFSFRKFR